MSLPRGRKRNADNQVQGSTIQLSSSAGVPTGSRARIGPSGTLVSDNCQGKTSGPTDTATGDEVAPPPTSGVRTRSRIRHVTYGKMCKDRVPRGKAVLLVFSLVVLERYVFTGAADNALHLIPAFADKDDPNVVGLRYVVSLLVLHSAGRVFYPVGGFIADVYAGRYGVIHVSLWLYWCACCLLVIGSTVHEATGDAKTFSNYVVPAISFPCIVIASGGLQSAIIPFGADQLEAANSNELSSYFYWFYFMIQVGSISSIFVDGIVTFLLSDHDLYRVVQPLISMGLISLALVLHNVCKNWYFRNIIRENCVKLVKDVLWYAATVKRHLPQYRRAFRYGEGKVPRINLAKQQYDGIFTEDQVEDVKTFCRICLVLLSFCGLFFTMSAVSNPLPKLSVPIKHTLNCNCNTLLRFTFLPLIIE